MAKEILEGIGVWKVLGFWEKDFGKLDVLRVLETKFPTFIGFGWVVNLESGGINVLTTTILGRGFFKVSVVMILTWTSNSSDKRGNKFSVGKDKGWSTSEISWECWSKICEILLLEFSKEL